MIPSGKLLRRSARLSKLVASSHQGKSSASESQSSGTDLSSPLLGAIRKESAGRAKRRKPSLEPQHYLAEGQLEASHSESDKLEHEGGGTITPVLLREMEEELWSQGYKYVAGVDEAGRGPLAGPVVAGACIIPAAVRIPGIDDSKKLTAADREAIFKILMEHPEVACATAIVDAAEIDHINILQATLRAMEKAVVGLGGPQPDFILVDGNQRPKGLAEFKCRTVVKGDSRSHVIAAASILAKVTRDKLMDEYDEQYPQYGFKQHKGYGTVKHMAALKLHGPCAIHRQSYRPVAEAAAERHPTLDSS